MWADHLLQEVHIHRDPKVKQEGNDITQAAFQSPTAHPVRYYERLIYCRHGVSSQCSTGEKKEKSEPRYRGRPWAATTSKSSPPGRCSKQACSCNAELYVNPSVTGLFCDDIV